jgi:hypothetical protein
MEFFAGAGTSYLAGISQASGEVDLDKCGAGVVAP